MDGVGWFVLLRIVECDDGCDECRTKVKVAKNSMAKTLGRGKRSSAERELLTVRNAQCSLLTVHTAHCACRWATLGGDHSMTRRSVNTLANLYARLGDRDKVGARSHALAHTRTDDVGAEAKHSDKPQ